MKLTLTSLGCIVGLGASCPLSAWTGAHNEASSMAALLSPPPFKQHPEWCAFAVYPDKMNDWEIAQSDHSRWAVRLLVREVVDALRNGDEARACFLASVAAHFPQDVACMSHSPLFKMVPEADTPNLDHLPNLLREWADRLPVERATRIIRRYGRGQGVPAQNKGFFTIAPPLMEPLYEATSHYAHDWLEDTAAALALPEARRSPIVGSKTLVGVEPWTLETIFPERFGQAPRRELGTWVPRLGSEGWSFYHRWIAAQYQGQWLLPFALFDEQSLRAGTPRFRDAQGLRAVFAEEYRNALEAAAALYRYASVAAQTDVQADWGAISTEDAKLDALAKDGVVIVVTEGRPDWRRSAEFLKRELEFAQQRVNARAPLHLVTAPELAGDAAIGKQSRNLHLIEFRRTENSATKPVLRIARRKEAPSRLEISLTVAQPEDMPNVVDVLLDEARAPLWSTSPPQTSIAALEQLWAGAKLAAELRAHPRTPDELFDYVLSKTNTIPFRNTDGEKITFAGLTKSSRSMPGLYPWLVWLKDVQKR